MSTGTLDALLLAAFLLFIAGFFYFIVVGVRHRDRAQGPRYLPRGNARVLGLLGDGGRLPREAPPVRAVRTTLQSGRNLYSC